MKMQCSMDLKVLTCLTVVEVLYSHLCVLHSVKTVILQYAYVIMTLKYTPIEQVILMILQTWDPKAIS